MRIEMENMWLFKKGAPEDCIPHFVEHASNTQTLSGAKTQTCKLSWHRAGTRPGTLHYSNSIRTLAGATLRHTHR